MNTTFNDHLSDGDSFQHRALQVVALMKPKAAESERYAVDEDPKSSSVLRTLSLGSESFAPQQTISGSPSSRKEFQAKWSSLAIKQNPTPTSHREGGAIINGTNSLLARPIAQVVIPIGCHSQRSLFGLSVSSNIRARYLHLGDGLSSHLPREHKPLGVTYGVPSCCTRSAHSVLGLQITKGRLYRSNTILVFLSLKMTCKEAAQFCVSVSQDGQ